MIVSYMSSLLPVALIRTVENNRPPSCERWRQMIHARNYSQEALHKDLVIVYDLSKSAFFWSRWRPFELCGSCVCGCSGWVDGNSTWDGSGLWSCSDGADAGLRPSLLILCHHVNLILCIPVQAVQHHILTVIGEAHLWFPVRYILLRKECRGTELKTQSVTVVVLHRQTEEWSSIWIRKEITISSWSLFREEYIPL